MRSERPPQASANSSRPRIEPTSAQRPTCTRFRRSSVTTERGADVTADVAGMRRPDGVGTNPGGSEGSGLPRPTAQAVPSCRDSARRSEALWGGCARVRAVAGPTAWPSTCSLSAIRSPSSPLKRQLGFRGALRFLRLVPVGHARLEFVRDLRGFRSPHGRSRLRDGPWAGRPRSAYLQGETAWPLPDRGASRPLRAACS